MREQILTFLERNSRIDLKELAVILGTDEVTIANEVAKMEQEKIICGYHTLIDWDKTSADKVTALIEVRVTPQRGQGFDTIAERIYNYPEVRSVYLISGAYDLMVILEGKTLKEVSGFGVRQAVYPGYRSEHGDTFHPEKIQRPRNDFCKEK